MLPRLLGKSGGQNMSGGSAASKLVFADDFDGDAIRTHAAPLVYRSLVYMSTSVPTSPVHHAQRGGHALDDGIWETGELIMIVCANETSSSSWHLRQVCPPRIELSELEHPPPPTPTPTPCPLGLPSHHQSLVSHTHTPIAYDTPYLIARQRCYPAEYSFS